MASPKYDKSDLIVWGVLGAILLFAYYSSNGSALEFGDFFGPRGFLFGIFCFFVSGVFAVIADCFVQANAAMWFGDSRPQRDRRRSISFRQHADVFGTYIAPSFAMLTLAIPLGWGKQVVLDKMVYRRRVAHPIIVKSSGAIVNLALSAIVLRLMNALGSTLEDGAGEWTRLLLGQLSLTCFCIGVLHLLPIPPLPGSYWFEAVMPKSWKYNYIRFSKYIPLAFGAFLMLFHELYMPKFGELLNAWESLVS